MKSYFNINVEDSLKDFNVSKDGLSIKTSFRELE